MPAIKYEAIPTLQKWQSDSSVTFAVRKQDKILVRIDALIARYHAAHGHGKIQSLILCDLFQTIEFWIKTYKGGSKWVEKGRYFPILNLFEGVVCQLKLVFKVNNDVAVSNCMKEMFAVGMDKSGCVTDENQDMKTFDEVQLTKYRVWFKGGLAYQLPWWDNSTSLRRQLANSSHGYLPVSRGGAAQSLNYSGFVMTLSREIYMTKQDIAKNHFHSSYNGGMRVTMAGTILIEDGRIHGVRTDSGHYQPGLHNAYTFLSALVMYQIDLKRINVYDFKNDFVATADKFIAQPHKWSTFLDGQATEQQKTFERRQFLGYAPKISTSAEEIKYV